MGGVAVGLVAGDEQPVVECLGLADRDRRCHVDAETVFRIASISKTLTGIGVMQLRDEGLVGLDEPANRYLSSFQIVVPPGAPAVTLRHLLTHTAGIGEVPRLADLVSRTAMGSGAPNAPGADLAALYGGALRVEVPPGSKWAYANHGFAVLGEVVENVAAVPFAQYMRQRVLRPLGMADADYVRTGELADRLATGYHWVLGRLRGLKDYDLVLMGPGSVLASLNDMIRYAQWLLAPERRMAPDVLATETLHEMMTPQYRVDPRLPTAMGLAFFLDRFGSHRVCGHDGNNPGFASSLLVAPDDGVGVIALTNTSSLIGAHQLAAAALRTLLGTPDPASLTTDVPTQPHLWPDLVGYYAPAPGFLTNFRNWSYTGGEVQVFIRRRRLWIRALSPLPQLRHGVELLPTDDSDPHLFQINVHGLVVPVAFATTPAGTIDRLAIGSPSNTTLHRRPTWRSSRERLIAATTAGLATTAIRRARQR